jgi:hypothetical protein
MAPKASQEVSTRRTRPANANTHPGRPVLEAEAEERLQNAKRKSRTKSLKATDDPHANESPEQKSARIQKAAERIAGIEDNMEALEAEVRGGIKAKPVRPRPRPHPVAKGKKTSSTDITDGMINVTLRIETDIDTHQMVKPLVLMQRTLY